MATTWQSHEFTLLLAEAGTTDATFLSYDGALSRVRADLAVLATINGNPPPAGATRVVERSTDLIRWAVVRGGAEAPIDTTAKVDDYEFVSGAQNFYRITVWVDGDLFWTFRDNIAVSVDQAWLKFPRYPFLNRPVTITDYGDPVRPSRTGVFDVPGRTMRVAVYGKAGSRQFDLEVMTSTLPEGEDFDLTLASNSAVFLQVPGAADCDIPTMYAALGDVTKGRRAARSGQRFWRLPVTEVAPPAPEFTGGTITCAGLLNRYATCADVLAAIATCADVLELVGSAGDVEVD